MTTAAIAAWDRTRQASRRYRAGAPRQLARRAKPRAIVFGCACHAVTLGQENLKLSGDYPSFAQEDDRVEQSGRASDVRAGLRRGCQQRPAVRPRRREERPSSGPEPGGRGLPGREGPLEPVRGPLRVKFSEVDLPLKPVPPRRGTREDVRHAGPQRQAHAGRAWNRENRCPPTISIPWLSGNSATDLTFVGLSGEVVSGYVPLVKRALGADRLWIAGYSNEVDGYLPDATIVAEGGYEARGLVADIGFYSAEAEKVLVKAVSELATGSESIPRAVQRELDAGLFPGAVVLVGRPGKVLYHDAFGLARIVPDKVKMRKDCIFDLASVTKVVATGTAFGVCVDDKRLRFDMPIRQALPELSGSGIDPITVAHLATHTSGFDNAKYYERAQGEAMLELMLGVSPKWKPGSRYLLLVPQHDSAGQDGGEGQRPTLGRVLPIADLPAAGHARHVLRTVARRRRAWCPAGPPEIGQIEDAQARVAGRPVGNAGLFSTAADLARFCEMMLGEGRLGDVRILSPRIAPPG